MSKPVVIETAGRIAASPEQIWPYLVEWERLGRWMKEASDFRVVSKHREGVDVIAMATIKIACDNIESLRPIGEFLAE